MSHMTPRDTLEGIRLIANTPGLVTKGDTDDYKATIQSHAARYIIDKRDGETDLGFNDWLDTVDIQAVVERQDGPADEVDPQ